MKHPLALSAAFVILQTVCFAAFSQDLSQGDSERGLLVRAVGEDAASFVPWKSESTLQEELHRLRAAGGGEVQILPGAYEIQQGVQILASKDIEIRGTRGTELVFAPEPEKQPRLMAEVKPGDQSLYVDDASNLHVGWNYQLYKPNGQGGRVLEFKITKIEGGRVDFSPKVVFMGHVKEIPSKCIIVEHMNFFTIKRSERISLINLNLNGNGRGNVRGHTTFCGVLATGHYIPGKRPTTMGLVVKNCTFRHLKGRGIAVYGMGGVVIEGNYFDDVDSQAAELDHLTTGIVRGNEIHNSAVGIALNDAFDALIENNVIKGCNTSVAFVKHFDMPWVNTGCVVRSNLIIGGKRPGAIVFSKPMVGNILTGNTIVNCPEQLRIVGAAGNVVSGNHFKPGK